MHHYRPFPSPLRLHQTVLTLATWCPRWDLNPHALTGTAPQAAAYANSATRARKFSEYDNRVYPTKPRRGVVEPRGPLGIHNLLAQASAKFKKKNFYFFSSLGFSAGLASSFFASASALAFAAALASRSALIAARRSSSAFFFSRSTFRF